MLFSESNYIDRASANEALDALCDTIDGITNRGGDYFATLTDPIIGSEEVFRPVSPVRVAFGSTFFGVLHCIGAEWRKGGTLCIYRDKGELVVEFDRFDGRQTWIVRQGNDPLPFTCETEELSPMVMAAVIASAAPFFA